MEIINFNNDLKLMEALNELEKDFSLIIKNKLNEVVFIKSNNNQIEFNKEKNGITIFYSSIKSALFTFFKALNHNFKSKEFNHNKKIDTLTYMIDLSRNNVYKANTLKQLIRYLVVLGYDAIGLYMEDTYEISEDPYFGKFRGKLTKAELKEVVDYASKFDLEVVPYIQTLGHLSTLFDFPKNRKYLEHQDFLMLRSDDTYNFIELMIKNIREVFTTNRIHVGMDEVTLLGRCRFLDKFGYIDKKELMKEHLIKVKEIANKYNFSISIWSDMFFTSTSTTAYDNVKEIDDIKLDEDINLVFWKYEKLEADKYDNIFRMHKKLTSNISFAGGDWKWIGYAPNNHYAFEHINESFDASIRNNIREYILTGWGDNGGETSTFAVLPSIYHLGNLNYGFYDNDEEFSMLTGVKMKEFMKIDELNKTPTCDLSNCLNSFNRIFLFNDILLGTYDQFIKKGQSELFHELKLHFKKLKSTKFGYIFSEYYDLASLLEIKCNIVLSLRDNYLKKDLEGLNNNLNELKKLFRSYNRFLLSFREAWDKESKPQGFDVQDIRLGGAKERVKHAINKIESFVQGKVESIPELEEERVDFYGYKDKFIERDDLNDPRVKCVMTKNINY